MASNASSSRAALPQPGKFNVSIGPSLGRALKARKGAESAPPKGPGKHPRDLHAIKYNFLPESIDLTRAATIEVKPIKEATHITVERPCVSKGDTETAQLFVGTEKPAMDYECILMYDPSTQQWILEKLDSTMVLAHDRKVTRPRKPATPPTQSSTSTPTPAAATNGRSSASQGGSVPKRKRSEIDAILEHELGLDDADGEMDDDYIVSAPASSKATPARRSPIADRSASAVKKTKPPPAKKIKQEPVKQESESEGEIVESKPLPPPRPAPPPQVKAKPPSPPVRAPPPRPPAVRKPDPPPQPLVPKPQPQLAFPPRPVSSISAPPAKPKDAPPGPSATPTAPINLKKRSHPADIEEETLEFGHPVQASPPKRARASSPPDKAKAKESFSLALPGGGQPPPALPPPPPVKNDPLALSFPGSSNIAVALPSSTAAPAVDDSDEEEWDEVQPTATAPVPAPISISLPGPSRTIVMEEIDPASTRMAADERDADAEEEEEEEIDMTAFEAEMNEQLGDGEGDAEGMDVEDFLARELEEPQQEPLDWGDDDEYSSSEESDED
ncbi:hypothetical protein OBBRIDRAFT_883482 [Obba rivulosa]|uniref:Transcription elongation factor Eaf N-terminal domain-containing protein n=1 Tax=Obba rivulosa TaxID=1052685 RepID=A0A8E2J6Q2_9APHY|nr:hypothetical protein OBBRIDRAFT_883482 [Obba rivulosa]